MAETEPLHVRVARALGCKPWVCENECGDSFCNGRWYCPCPGKEHAGLEMDDIVARYDTDWAATGPLIERFG